ncbi:MAG: hypothetical protein IKZ81_06820 [Clostridia bacterium]|nr:hypothetical protein [Clostridia bacterium]
MRLVCEQQVSEREDHSAFVIGAEQNEDEYKQQVSVKVFSAAEQGG